ncbi:MAG: hypothetical protein OEY00_04540 [Gammaproteobacteria bacterium]|nr:hypothetical protein [Gammaproteobacteria bacterium]
MNIFKLLISGVCFFGLFAVVNAKPQQNNQVFQIAKGPPAHAKAHGYRKKRMYHYYPGAQVYFDSGRGLYFYLSVCFWL